MNLGLMAADHIPGRIFLDSSTLQTLQDYGEFIYDGGKIASEDKIWSIPDGFNNLHALRQIISVASRSSLELALSHNSLGEVIARRDPKYLQWAFEMLTYWEGYLASYSAADSAFTGNGLMLAEKLKRNQFGYLSTKDCLLIRDALLLECDVFLTMENKLPKNAGHLYRELGLRVVQPAGCLEMLKPWLGWLV